MLQESNPGPPVDSSSMPCGQDRWNSTRCIYQEPACTYNRLLVIRSMVQPSITVNWVGQEPNTGLELSAPGFEEKTWAHLAPWSTSHMGTIWVSRGMECCSKGGTGRQTDRQAGSWPVDRGIADEVREEGSGLRGVAWLLPRVKMISGLELLLGLTAVYWLDNHGLLMPLASDANQSREARAIQSWPQAVTKVTSCSTQTGGESLLLKMHFLMSLNTETSIWGPTRSFTPIE